MYLLELYSNIRLEVYIFVYIYLIRLILKKLEKKKRIAYLSLSTKKLYNLKISKLRILSDKEKLRETKISLSLKFI